MTYQGARNMWAFKGPVRGHLGRMAHETVLHQAKVSGLLVLVPNPPPTNCKTNNRRAGGKPQRPELK